jgi:2'-hydroxyisoflavone reductase
MRTAGTAHEHARDRNRKGNGVKLLILGGTVFLGRHLVEAALTRGHEVTLFNRGQHNANLYPAVEKLRGDRDGGLDALRGRRWDAVVDTCGYVPRLVRASADALKDAVDRYAFISTISVYRDLSASGADEEAPVGMLDDEATEEVSGETYGPLKALCERAAERAMPGRVLTIRLGLIVGPHDPTGRFTYWPRCVAQGGDMLAPAPADRRVQFIDARDLAAWTVRMVEAKARGTYNATGPDESLTFGQLLDACVDAGRADARPVWVDEAFLLEQGIEPWVEVPLWIPQADERLRGFLAIDVRKALGAGLTIRPLADTVRNTLAWDATCPSDAEHTAGLRPEREAMVLRAWRQRHALH